MALTIQDIIAQPPTEAAHIVAVAAVSEAVAAVSEAEAAVAVAAAQDKFGIQNYELGIATNSGGVG